MKKSNLIFSTLTCTFILFLITISAYGFKPMSLPGEWIVANNYTVIRGEEVGSGWIGDTYYYGAGDPYDFLVFKLTYIQTARIFFGFDNVHADKIGFYGWGNIFNLVDINIYVYYTDGSHTDCMIVPEYTLNIYNLNSQKVVDFVIVYFGACIDSPYGYVDYIRIYTNP